VLKLTFHSPCNLEFIFDEYFVSSHHTLLREDISSIRIAWFYKHTPHVIIMEIGILQLQVRNCGTAFQLNCDKLTLAFNDSNGY